MNLLEHLLEPKEAEQQDKDGLIKDMSWTGDFNSQRGKARR